MTQQPRSAILTELVLEVFRLNGSLIAAGDRLVADIGLTSARWQVLGAVALMPEPAPVVRIADSMGLTRQAVQRIVDELAADGIFALTDNPRHKRARLVTLTARGEKLFAAAGERQRPWATALAAGSDRQALQAALDVLMQLRMRLEQSAQDGGQP